MEDIIIEEESVESKIFGIQAQIDQMNRMIAENERLIAEGDDVVGRTYLMGHLKRQVEEDKRKIEKLKSQQ